MPKIYMTVGRQSVILITFAGWKDTAAARFAHFRTFTRDCNHRGVLAAVFILAGMCDRLPSVRRIEAQIASLNTQEQDALQLLLRKPNVSVQVSGVLARIRKDREHLTAVLRESITNGRSVIQWGDLVAEHSVA